LPDVIAFGNVVANSRPVLDTVPPVPILNHQFNRMDILGYVRMIQLRAKNRLNCQVQLTN